MKEYYSTVEAAKICNVTRFSIINWTDKGLMRTRKTPGGHRRIYHEDLRAFIKTYGIGLDSIKDSKFIDQADYLRCWEFHRNAKRGESHKCKKCVVFLSGTKKCYTLRKELGHQKIFCKTSCTHCKYHKKVHQAACV